MNEWACNIRDQPHEFPFKALIKHVVWRRKTHCETTMMSLYAGELNASIRQQGMFVRERHAAGLQVCFSIRRDLGSSLNVALSGVWGALGYIIGKLYDLVVQLLSQVQLCDPVTSACQGFPAWPWPDSVPKCFTIIPRKWGLGQTHSWRPNKLADRIMLCRQQTLCKQIKLLMILLLLLQ